MARVSESCWPFTNVATTDAQYSWLLREIGQGVTNSNGASTLAGSADSSGMVTKVEPGRAIIRGYMYRNTDQFTVTHDPSATNPRIDTVVVELNVSAVSPSDRATVIIVKGTHAATPVAPTLTQSDTGIYQFPLYNVLIGANITNIGPSAVTDRRVWKGMTVGQWTTATRPSSPTPSQLGYNTTLARWERWNGSAWVGIDSATVGGRTFYDGTTVPSSGLGVDNDIYFKYTP